MSRSLPFIRRACDLGIGNRSPITAAPRVNNLVKGTGVEVIVSEDDLALDSVPVRCPGVGR